jgi:uncharacterized protein (DUF1778 family)
MPQTAKQAADRERIPVSLPKAAARLIGRAAARRHKSKSAFIRDASIEAAEKVLAGPTADTDVPPIALAG